MDYAKKKRMEMQWWQHFRLAAMAVLSIGAAGFLLYCLCRIAERPLRQVEQAIVPEAGVGAGLREPSQGPQPESGSPGSFEGVQGGSIPL
ncbi:hypothetical protein [Solimonas sp. K1W22B-7]|uniref:hypothetical protein n=1 Tax=Solimonas sp. K1W22B-7 TaxID=2303331 RepID=UPI0013C4BC17|nr:hypothetical protein [Solimonas sp. K1W22B-7]